MKIFKKIFNKTRAEESYINNAIKYVNSNNFVSNTKYFIWVDLKNFKVNIFTGTTNNWKIVHSYLCTIGKKATPTPKGTYTVGVKGLYFGVNKGYKCWYYTQFKGNYLFHSIIYNLDGSIKDGRLGMALSDGCIRLEKVNAKWIFDNVLEGSKVLIS